MVDFQAARYTTKDLTTLSNCCMFLQVTTLAESPIMLEPTYYLLFKQGKITPTLFLVSANPSTNDPSNPTPNTLHGHYGQKCFAQSIPNPDHLPCSNLHLGNGIWQHQLYDDGMQPMTPLLKLTLEFTTKCQSATFQTLQLDTTSTTPCL